ncbi:hypothetical protein [Planctomycetes bacterium CA13]
MTSPANGEIVTYTPAFDATLRDDGFDGTFDSGGNANPFNSIQRTDNVVNEVLFFEFDLTGLDSSAVVESASISFTILGTPTASGNIDILAYQADGVLTFPDDGSRIAQTVANYDPITLGGGTISVVLNTAVVNGFLNSGSYLGIRMQGSETNAATDIRGISTTAAGIPPTLSLSVVAVPEPTSFALILVSVLPAIACRRRKRTLK